MISGRERGLAGMKHVVDEPGRNLPTDRTLKHTHRSKSNKHARVTVDVRKSGFCGCGRW